jgi:putative peptide zinc metalloprotease protein
MVGKARATGKAGTPPTLIRSLAPRPERKADPVSGQELSIDLSKVRGLDEAIPADTSEKGVTYLLIGENGGHLRVSASTRQLLRWIKAGFSFPDLAERLSRQQGSEVSPEFLAKVYEHALFNLQAADATNARGMTGSFWLRLRFIPAVWVARISPYLAVLFRPQIALPLLLGVAAAVLALGPHAVLGRATAGQFWAGYGLFLLSLIFHEFGHASACARYGVPPSEIGFTMYLVYPAFYSNVTGAWQLPRWQRVVVDLGGNFFQALVGAVYVVIFLVSGQEAYRVAVWMIIYGAAFSLNPIFKFDGYWMMSDALGVVNLGEQPQRILSHAYRRLLRRPVEPLPWPRSVVAMLAVYTPLSFAFWIYFLGRLLPLVWTTTLNYPALLIAAWGQLGSSALWQSVQTLLLRTLMLLIVYVMLFRLGRIVLNPFRGALAKLRGRARAERDAGLGTAPSVRGAREVLHPEHRVTH